MNHICSAIGCREPVQRPQFMCRAHWFAVPKKIRDEVWAAHRARPFNRLRSLRACKAAIESVSQPDASQASNQPPVSPSAAGIPEGKTS